MSKVAIIGAGFAGQTAALYLGSALGRDHEITVINRSGRFLYYPDPHWMATPARVGLLAEEVTAQRTFGVLVT